MVELVREKKRGKNVAEYIFMYLWVRLERLELWLFNCVKWNTVALDNLKKINLFILEWVSVTTSPRVSIFYRVEAYDVGFKSWNFSIVLVEFRWNGAGRCHGSYLLFTLIGWGKRFLYLIQVKHWEAWRGNLCFIVPDSLLNFEDGQYLVIFAFHDNWEGVKWSSILKKVKNLEISEKNLCVSVAGGPWNFEDRQYH